jgi:head-tail adaptor
LDARGVAAYIGPMVVSAGRLRIPFRLERPAETVAAGEATPHWVDEGLWWGDVEGVASASRGGLTAEAEVRIRGRYRPDLTPRWRLRDAAAPSRIYAIASAVPTDSTRAELLILATEIVGTENPTP